MNVRLLDKAAVLGGGLLMVSMLLTSASAMASPRILTVTVNDPLITITGRGFGPTPVVVLGTDPSIPLTIQNSSDTLIEALSPVAGCPVGDALMGVFTDPTNDEPRDVRMVSFGAVGPQGPAGTDGLNGLLHEFAMGLFKTGVHLNNDIVLLV